MDVAIEEMGEPRMKMDDVALLIQARLVCDGKLPSQGLSKAFAYRLRQLLEPDKNPDLL